VENFLKVEKWTSPHINVSTISFQVSNLILVERNRAKLGRITWINSCNICNSSNLVNKLFLIVFINQIQEFSFKNNLLPLSCLLCDYSSGNGQKGEFVVKSEGERAWLEWLKRVKTGTQ